MASRGGGMVDGTTGADYMHRQQVAPHYQQSVVYKGRLRWCGYWHAALLLLQLLRLTPDILDRLDIFVLELEQLELPKPHWLEWVWVCGGGAGAALAAAARRNSVRGVGRARVALAALAAAPALAALALWAPEVPSCDDPYLWQGYCVATLYVWFAALCLQCHALQLHSASRLLQVWRDRKLHLN